MEVPHFVANKYKAELEWRDIESITPYVNNIKKHPTEQIDKLAEILNEKQLAACTKTTTFVKIMIIKK